MRVMSLSLIVLLTAFVSMTVAAAESDVVRERPSRRYAEVSIPNILKEDIIKRQLDFAARIFPTVDKGLLREDFEKYLAEEPCRIPVYQAPGPYLFIPEGSQKIASGSSLSPWTNLGLTASEPLGALDLDEKDLPLTAERAQALAKPLLRRLVPNVDERASMELTIGGRGDHSEILSMTWEAPNRKPYNTHGTVIKLRLRKSDGALMGASMTFPLEQPRFSHDEMVAKAKKELPSFRDEHLELKETYHFADRRLIWEYGWQSVGYIGDYSRWDANTGELLYSEVLNGGKLNGAYMNPSFYSYPPEDEVRAMVEKLLKKRADELEKQKGKE